VTDHSQLDGRPCFTPDTAARLLHAWQITAEVSGLDSERDQNWLVQAGGQPSHVLKIANRHDGSGLLGLQQSMMRRLSAAGLPCPAIIPTPAGAWWTEADGHLAWLITYLPGRRLTDVVPSAVLLDGIGELVGRAALALAGFDHPAARRRLQWDVARASQVIGDYRLHVTEPGRRALLDRVLDRYQAQVEPLLGELPSSVIHNDANDHNLLVSGDTVTGLLDFGDAVHSVTVNDLAIACTYAMLGSSDPALTARCVTAGYERWRLLSAPEHRVLPHLIMTRLATSAAISAYQQTIHPDNAYLRVSELPAWRLLAWLEPEL
jgi:Ser/Thr protein kinase RdoA (MazF antagonist)